MPTADGRIKGISLSGVSNPWLERVAAQRIIDSYQRIIDSYIDETLAGLDFESWERASECCHGGELAHFCVGCPERPDGP